MVYSSSQADFGFKIDFARDTEDPARVFRALSGLIDFCKITDKILIKSLDIDDIEPDLLLENIDQGSIRVWLKIILKPANDNILQKLRIKAFLSYLVEAKSSIIKFINNRDTINDISELSELKERLISLAKETEINNLGIYLPPSDKDLLSSIDKCQSAKSELQAADKLYYMIGSSNIPINRDFSISPESLENLRLKEAMESESIMILKVKKPDYLGESKWEFRHGKRIIEAKINDLEWLQQFREREIFIAPGDAVRAEVKIVRKYDYNGELISTKHTIQKIIEIIPMSPDTQLSLFPDTN